MKFSSGDLIVPAFLFFSVKFFINLFELSVGDVCVDLSGGNGRVAEHSLDRADIGAIA